MKKSDLENFKKSDLAEFKKKQAKKGENSLEDIQPLEFATIEEFEAFVKGMKAQELSKETLMEKNECIRQTFQRKKSYQKGN